MLASSIVAFIVVYKLWKKSLLFSLCLITPFFLVELVFFSSNLIKLFDGGYVPLAFGVYFILLIIIWVKGTEYLIKRAREQSISMADLAQMLERDPPARVSGTAIFLTGDSNYAPETMIQNLKHNQVFHEKNIILTVSFGQVPRVSLDQRIKVEEVNKDILRIIVYFGFMETPNVPAALYRARALGYDIDVEGASFFLGHRKLVADPHHGLPLWQDYFYIGMAKNAVDATDYFRIPPSQVVEIGTRQFV
jgi:KUP system potassium uptake protein